MAGRGRRARESWLAALLLCFLAACATPPRRGIDLSDAQREAAKDESEKKEILVPEDPPEEAEEVEEAEGPSKLRVALAVVDAIDPPGTPSQAATEPTRPKERHTLSLVGTGLTFDDEVLVSQDGPGAVLGFYPAPQLRVGIGGYHLDGAAGTRAEGLDAFEEWAGEVSARVYFTADHTLVGAYALAGFRAGLLRWDYAQPLTVQDGAYAVTLYDDALTSYSVFVGAGLSPLQLKGLHLGGGVIVGTRMFQSVTHQGFDNDVFATTGFRQVYCEATALF